MGASEPRESRGVEGLLKALLVLSRTVDQVLECGAVESVSGEPLAESKTRIIRLLGHSGRQNSTRIAAFLGVTKPAVTQIVASLVRSKLVVRQNAEEDNREVLLELTSRGKELFRAMRRRQAHLLRLTTRGVKPAVVQAWIDTARHIAVSVAQADQTFGQFCMQCGAHSDGTCVLVGGAAVCRFLQHRSQTLAKSRSNRRIREKHRNGA